MLTWGTILNHTVYK